jgi:hypothetical protein
LVAGFRNAKVICRDDEADGKWIGHYAALIDYSSSVVKMPSLINFIIRCGTYALLEV